MGRSCIGWSITDSVYVNECGILNDLLSDDCPIYCIRNKDRERVVCEWKYVGQNLNFDSDVLNRLVPFYIIRH